MADRLKVGDESSARLLLRTAMRCSPEHTLFVLSIPCGAGAGKVGSRAAEIGLEIAMAAEAVAWSPRARHQASRLRERECRR